MSVMEYFTSPFYVDTFGCWFLSSGVRIGSMLFLIRAWRKCFLRTCEHQFRSTIKSYNNVDQKLLPNTKSPFLIRYQGEIENIAEQADLSKQLDVRLAMKEMTKNGPIMYSIITDTQLGLELPSILNRTYILQGMFFMLLEKSFLLLNLYLLLNDRL